ncbi:hypothetical protein G7085_16490 [Tessaracoccus sp. HDW20]|uniref:hypothetical protein n=1 Tax=Tessaracoccus coleopterorum TaxID=2714950 RepID=UPI0018D2A5EE|nr:hypothetical protein [Tessaracoccus coleopterorum]
MATLDCMTKLRTGLAALLLALLSTWAVVLPAHADTDAPITRYDAKVNLTPQGVAEVTIDFTMDFGVVRGRGPIVILPPGRMTARTRTSSTCSATRISP